MSFRLVNRPEVKSDITSAIDYYKKISPSLAKQFIFRVREARNSIAKSPQKFQIRYREVRVRLLKQFPYHIHYFIDFHKNEIVILAIIHSYRKPKDFSKRLP